MFDFDPRYTEPDFTDPNDQRSVAGSWRRALRRWREAFHNWRRIRRDQRIARAAFLHVLALDDRALDDIGLTREEAMWGARLPLRVDAAKAAHARSRKRRNLSA